MNKNNETITPGLSKLLQVLPKAELHVHLEGSLEPEMMFSIARRNNLTLPYDSVNELRAVYTFTNLQSFLDLYYQGVCILLTKQDFFDVAWAYLQRAHADHVVRAEIFFDVQSHMARGVPAQTVIAGFHSACEHARTHLGISAELILCFLRDKSEQDAFQALEAALPWREHFIGVGLASSEVGHPPQKFTKIFSRCRELGLHLVAHAGEEAPPSYIWDAINLLGVERIDHGVQAIHDEALMNYLAQKKIPLTVCPLSNLKLHVFDKLSKDNIGRLLKHGICVTINSDDPAYFGGYINDNYSLLIHDLNLDANDVLRLAINSIEASFAPEHDKIRWIKEINSIAAHYFK